MTAGKTIPSATLEAICALERLARLQGIAAGALDGEFWVEFRGLRGDSKGSVIRVALPTETVLPAVLVALAGQAQYLMELGVNLGGTANFLRL